MGLSNMLEDTLVKVINKGESVRLPYDKMAELVHKYFIEDADDEFLREVSQTAKGGTWFKDRKLESSCGKYTWRVSAPLRSFNIFAVSKNVWIHDKQRNIFYIIEKRSHWKKFYQKVKTDIALYTPKK